MDANQSLKVESMEELGLAASSDDFEVVEIRCCDSNDLALIFT